MTGSTYFREIRSVAERHRGVFSERELEDLESWIETARRDPEGASVYRSLRASAAVCVLAAAANPEKEEPQDPFADLLKSLRPDPGLLSAWRAVVLAEWEEWFEEMRSRNGRLQQRIENLEQQKGRLLDLMLRDVIDEPTFKVRVEKIDQDLVSAKDGQARARVDDWGFRLGGNALSPDRHRAEKRGHQPAREAPKKKSSLQTKEQESKKVQPKPMGRGAFLTEEAANYTGLSPKTLETMRSRGGGPPFVKLGRRVVYRPQDLDAWIADRLRKSTCDAGS